MTETVYATDVQLTWEKSTPCIKSGFKNGKVPHGAVAGGNGTFIITTPLFCKHIYYVRIKFICVFFPIVRNDFCLFLRGTIDVELK